MEVVKQVAYLQVSTELFEDMLGIGPPSKPPTLRQRARWRWQAFRYKVGKAVGEWIAGEQLCDCW